MIYNARKTPSIYGENRLIDENGGLDYRDTLIEDRMKKIKYIIMVASGKGGVGKSIIAATTSLTLADKGYIW